MFQSQIQFIVRCSNFEEKIIFYFLCSYKIAPINFYYLKDIQEFEDRDDFNSHNLIIIILNYLSMPKEYPFVPI